MSSINMNPPTQQLISDCVYDIKLKFEPFYVDYNLDQEVVKLPRLFNSQHIHEIAPKVFLCDLAGNMFQIVVEKHNTEAYFVEGWAEVGQFYGLVGGGWVKLVFVGWDMFLMELRDRLDQPVNYPLPAKIHWLGEVPLIADYPRREPVASYYSSICKKPAIFHTLDKNLTHDDVSSGFLQIPLHFCQVAFRQSGLKVMVFDEYGRNATCIVQYNPNSPTRCGLKDGWGAFCAEKAYFEGLRIQLAVPLTTPTLMSIIVKHIML